MLEPCFLKRDDWFFNWWLASTTLTEVRQLQLFSGGPSADLLGPLQLLPLDESGTPPGAVEGEPLSDAAIANLLRELPRFPMGSTNGHQIRLSLAGNHEKTALLRHEEHWLRPIGPTPTTHILKLPIGTTPDRFDLSLSVENEWLCHRLLGELGFPVAPAQIADFEDQRCLVVTRFDRLQTDKGILRLPHEDLCQATGTASAFKYESDGGPGIKRCLKLSDLCSKAPAETIQKSLPADFPTEVSRPILEGFIKACNLLHL
jgi:serine/threonine protein kinase HipA of HipAB toxin-antitoxin module